MNGWVRVVVSDHEGARLHLVLAQTHLNQLNITVPSSTVYCQPLTFNYTLVNTEFDIIPEISVSLYVIDDTGIEDTRVRSYSSPTN